MNNGSELGSLVADEVNDLVTAVRRAAARWRNQSAWIFDETGETLSFEEIDQRSDRMAGALSSLGVQAGDHVAIMLRNCPQWPLSWISLLKLGAVMVPLNIHYRSTDAGFIIEHAEVSTIITSEEFVQLLTQVKRKGDDKPTLLSIDGEADGRAVHLAAYLESGHRPPGQSPDQSDLINIQYTSGTTGQPKGCMLSHFWLMSFARRVVRMHQGLDQSDVMLTSQPFYYVDPQWNVATALVSGATLVVLDRFHPSTFWDKVRQYKVTWFYCLGVMPKLLLKTPAAIEDRGHSLKRVVCSAIPPIDHAQIVKRWGVPWYDAFGMTESGLDLAVSIEDHDSVVGTGCIGSPIPGREVRVVDENDHPVGDEVVGQLILRGEGLLDGYYKNPEATAATIKNGWLHTGDLVRRDACNRFYYVGRIKDMIRRGGENIAAAEVESVIMQHELVHLAACIAVPDEIRDEEILAYVVLKSDSADPEQMAKDIGEFCLSQLAYFKVPRYWKFRKTLPMTPSERVQKERLKSAKGDPISDSFDRIEGQWSR